MRDLAELNQLIDKASAIAGSDYKLAQTLGYPTSALSNWRHGAKTCPPADVALIAEVAGLDPVAWAMKAMVSKYTGTPKGDRLMHAVGKALLATGAAIGSAGASATAIFSTMPTPSHIVEWTAGLLCTMYTNVKSNLRLKTI